MTDRTDHYTTTYTHMFIDYPLICMDGCACVVVFVPCMHDAHDDGLGTECTHPLRSHEDVNSLRPRARNGP